MDVNELTIAAAILWLLVVALAGWFVGWGWALLAAGMGALVGLEAALASERSARRNAFRSARGQGRCPRCGHPVAQEHAVCPSCLAELKTNCPRCGSVIDRHASKG